MSSYYCCIGQKPPSPEGIPLRTVKLSTDVLHKTSWSTVSYLSKPENVAELRKLFEARDSDLENDNSKNITLKRSTSTLDFVKSKLRKHLSRESALSKHRPRSTVGNSDEEIQRRKELRSIRDRRIKEDLSGAGAYDDDAKSLSTVATENTPRMAWHKTCSEHTDCLESLEASPPSLSLRKSANACYTWNSPNFSAIQRRHSLAVLENPKEAHITEWAIYQDSPDLTMPPAPKLKPQILPSIVDSATRRTSWRLSFASDQRATHLRALSQEYEPLPAATAVGLRGHMPSPLGWFHGQAPCALPAISAGIPGQLNTSDASPLQTVDSSAVEDCQGVDGNTELRTVPIFLHEMQISRRLASRGLHSYSSSPQLSSWGSQSHYCDRSYTSQSSHNGAMIRGIHQRSASNVAILDAKLSTCWGDLLRDRISSIYNCVDPVSKTPNFSVPSLLRAESKEISYPNVDSHDLTAFQRLPAGATTINTTEPKPLVDSVLLAKQEVRRSVQRSKSASKALSFLEREAELAIIETQFPKAMTKSAHTSSIRSIFNEEFGEQHRIPDPATPCRRPSVSTFLQLPKLARLVSRTYDGASLFELQVPGRQGFGFAFSNRSRSTAGTVSPGARSSGANSPVKHPSLVQPEDAEGIWSQSLKKTQEKHKLQRASTSSPAKKDPNDHHVQFLTNRNGSWKSEERNRERLLIGSRDFVLEKELSLQRKIEIGTSKAAECAGELEVQERRTQAISAAVAQYPSPWRPKMPPDSWACFPSHTHEERTASAGVPDHVSPKDFAVRNIEDGVVEWMKSDRKHHHRYHEKKLHHSMPVKISKQVRTSLYKLRTLKSSAMGGVIHGRKSSVSVGGKLEYPELEILAGEIVGGGLFEEIENETEEDIRRRERAARMVVFGEDGMNGEVDVEENMTVAEAGETSQISIADPRFYDDCVTLPPQDDEVDDVQSKSSITATPVGKTDTCKLEKAIIKTKESRTWSGRNRAGILLMSGTALRRSTLDFQVELETMETLERDRAIRSAEEAWGESVAQGYH